MVTLNNAATKKILSGFVRATWCVRWVKFRPRTSCVVYVKREWPRAILDAASFCLHRPITP